MNKIFQLVLVCYVCLIVFILIDLGDANDVEVNATNHIRQKRYLAFRNKTVFFWRLNFKANMVAWTQIFAQAIGFRLNWMALPDSYHPYHHLHRRTVYTHLETLLDRNGLNGYHCVRRAICEMESVDPRGIYQKILKVLFRRQSSATDKWHKTTKGECLLSIDKCPMSVMGISQYTDVLYPYGFGNLFIMRIPKEWNKLPTHAYEAIPTTLGLFEENEKIQIKSGIYTYD